MVPLSADCRLGPRCERRDTSLSGMHLLDAKDLAPGGVAYATRGSNPGQATPPDWQNYTPGLLLTRLGLTLDR